MTSGKCDVGEIASRQREVSKYYVGKTGVGDCALFIN